MANDRRVSQSEIWAVIPVKGGALAKQRLADALSPRLRKDLALAMFQDVLDADETVYKKEWPSGKVSRVTGFGDILRASASHCIFSGVGKDGTLYVMLERGLTDIYSLDLDLP